MLCTATRTAPFWLAATQRVENPLRASLSVFRWLVLAGLICFQVQTPAASSNGQEEVVQPVFLDGAVGPLWTGGIQGFDEANDNFAFDCANDGGAACPSLNWGVISERG